jgi:hypothetical protein
MFSKARYLSKIASWEEAVVAYNEILQREKLGTSKKIDVAMEKAKIALFNLVTARFLYLDIECTIRIIITHNFVCIDGSITASRT